MPPFNPNLVRLLLFALTAFRADGQALNGTWVYPSATGNLLYQLDERGQRIADFSQCGYRGGSEPLPDVAALIPQSRWVVVNPGSGDDTALIQAAIDSVEALPMDASGWRGVVFLKAGEYQVASTLTINASGVVLKGEGDSATTGTRLRATAAVQYNLISVTGSGSRGTVANTTRNLTQKLVPAGARTFEVDSTSGLAVGHSVIVKRPSTANWIADIDMDQLGPAPVVPWAAGSKDLLFDRVITRIEGNWITVDVPLPQTFESVYGGGQIWRYTWTGRIQQVGIEDLYGFSDYASATDENHAWKCIQISNAQHAWVRNITAQYFGYSAVSVGDGAKWLTVADSQCLDPISLIDGGRRYSFNNDGAECTLFVNNYARKGRHDFVFGATVPGPNAFVHCTADTVYSDTGPHHRWSVGGLFDLVTINGNQINVRNRGNSGTGHGWAGAHMVVWNCKASSFSVRNPPTARNWLVGSIGTIASSSGFSVGADPPGTYDSSGPTGTGKAVLMRSLYYGQLQQRMKWPGSDFREVWLGDVDQHSSSGGTGETVNCDAAWLSQVEAIGAPPADAKFDFLVGNRHTACTLDFSLDPGDTIVAASLTVSLRGIGSAAADSIWLDSAASPQTYASLGWTPISTTAPAVRTMEVSPSLLADGRLNLAFGPNTAVDFATLHLQVQAAQNAGYSSRGTLDVSALAAFNTNVTTFNMGVGSTTTGVGNVLLSNTANTIQATTLAVANTGGNNGNGTSTLTLGTGTNVIRADTIEIGKGKGSSPGMVKFASQIPGSPGTVTIADKAGTAAANITVANVNGVGTSGGAIGTLDLRGHTATVDAGTLLISRNNGGSSTAASSTNGTVHFDAGTFTAATLIMAQKSAVATGTATATLNVGGGSFTVNTAFTLGSQTGSGASVATLNLTGGTLNTFANILEGGGNTTSKITLDGGTLNLNGNAIGGATPIDTLEFKSGTVQDVSQINNGTGGLTKTTLGTLTITGTNSYTGATTVSTGTLALSGSLAGPLTVNGGILAPQGLPATASDFALNAGGTFQARVTGSTDGTQYDQFAAGGTVTLAGPLDLAAGPGLAPGTSFRILNKTSAGPVSGTFSGKPESSVFTDDGYPWIISYVGGDGNDVVLTLAAPIQAWRFQYFGTIENSGAAADTFDANGDGEVNLLEFATGQNPHAASLVVLTAIRSASALEITYTRSKEALTGGMIFAVEWSDTLAPNPWSVAGVTQEILTDNGTVQSVKATVPNAAAIPKRFARLKVTSP
jgi:autotransporter-associated beta strand protein